MASFVPLTYAFGDVIVKQGDSSDSVYVIESGRVRVLLSDALGHETSLNALNPGDSFGEVGVIRGAPRAATIRAASEQVRVHRLDGAVLRAMAATNAEVSRSLELSATLTDLQGFLQRHGPFGNLPPEGLRVLLEGLDEVRVAAGEEVIHQGDPAGPLYIVREGRLRAFDQDSDVNFIRTGDVFGERSLFAGERRAVTVVAVTDCVLLRLSARTFRRLMKGWPLFRSAVEQQVEGYRFASVARVPLDFTDEILPAAAAVADVGPSQVDYDVEVRGIDRGAEPFEVDGRFRKGPGRIRRVPFVRQVDEMDCGAACVAMICRYFGRPVGVSKIRHVVRTTVDGTSLRGLAAGAEQLGLAARTVKASHRNLDLLPLPAIVHLKDRMHWVVLYDVDSQWVRVADPSLGRRRIKRPEFDAKWSGYAALFERTPAFDETPLGGRGFGWLWSFFRPYRGRLAVAVVLAVVVGGLEMLMPVFVQLVVDRVVPGRDFGLLQLLLLTLVAVLGLTLASSFGQRVILARVAVGVDRRSLDQVAGRLLSLPLGYFMSRRTGDIQRRLTGMQQVRQFIVQNGVIGLSATTQLVAAVTLMLIYSPVLTLVFLAAAPLYGVMIRYAAVNLRSVFDSLEEAFGLYHARQIDAVKGIEAVKAMGAEHALRGQLLSEFDALSARLYRSDLVSLVTEGAVQLVGIASFAGFVWVGALLVLGGQLTVGKLVAFNALVIFGTGAIQTLLSLWDHTQLAAVLVTRLSDVFDEEPEQGADHSRLRPVPSLGGAVRLEGLGFRYGGKEAPLILDDLSLDVSPGTTVALVGRSGSGKTTLARCLAGLIEPTAGRILYDGLDLATLDYGELRRHIGVVLQDSYVFSDTIAANIAFGDTRVDPGQVEWAARIADADEFIDRLPLGYETRIGESGIQLSGGQKQRIAIARAVYRDPSVLILDEATSSLDSEAERSVQANIGRLLEGRTSFIIAHRLSTVRDADVIVVIERGRIAEVGDHDELMARKGLYFYLVGQQLAL